jgi:hypothetical protein
VMLRPKKLKNWKNNSENKKRAKNKQPQTG